MESNFVAKSSENKKMPKKLPYNPNKAYINILGVAGKAPKTTIEAKYVVKKLEEAGINTKPLNEISTIIYLKWWTSLVLSICTMSRSDTNNISPNICGSKSELPSGFN